MSAVGRGLFFFKRFNMKTAAFRCYKTPPSQKFVSRSLSTSSVANVLPEDLVLDSYDYTLPPEFIAQNPANPRDSCKLLVADMSRKCEGPLPVKHAIFRDLPQFVKPGDLLVMNDTKVIPARLYGRKQGRDVSSEAGAHVEVLLLEEVQEHVWEALVRPGKKFKMGTVVTFGDPSTGGPHLSATVVGHEDSTGGRLIRFDLPLGAHIGPILDKLGEMPLPPYITQSTAASDEYQTIYSKRPGSAAAPTAGLHFTEDLLHRLDQHGVRRTFVTLHVGVGTFRPVEAKDITSHSMHNERVQITQDAVDALQQCREQGGRVIAIGTTAARALEGVSAAVSQQAGALPSSRVPLEPFNGRTDIFIYPGYKWRIVDGIITNFHLPKSTLLMMISAMIGRPNLLHLYDVAIQNRYRFYSFGDAMLLLPNCLS